MTRKTFESAAFLKLSNEGINEEFSVLIVYRQSIINICLFYNALSHNSAIN